MLDGRADQQNDLRRVIASWAAPVLSALAGEVVYAEALLGEKTVEEIKAAETEQKLRDAQKKHKQMQRKLAKLNAAKKAEA